MPTEAELLAQLAQSSFTIEDRVIIPHDSFEVLFPAEIRAITLLCDHYDYTCLRDDIL